MDEYAECQDCGFVVRAAGSTTPERVDSCPDCGSTDFGSPDPLFA